MSAHRHTDTRQYAHNTTTTSPTGQQMQQMMKLTTRSAYIISQSDGM